MQLEQLQAGWDRIPGQGQEPDSLLTLTSPVTLSQSLSLERQEPGGGPIVEADLASASSCGCGKWWVGLECKKAEGRDLEEEEGFPLHVRARELIQHKHTPAPALGLSKAAHKERSRSLSVEHSCDKTCQPERELTLRGPPASSLERVKDFTKAANSSHFINRHDFFDYPDSDKAKLLAVAQFIGENTVIFTTSDSKSKISYYITMGFLVVVLLFLLFQLCTHM
ncbi:PREDICTED: uncharacterized protein C16orf92 homolog [Condylura cristata]|uniref:uncharacterized protein C16orf92 homolog n=1 Tax=Condylura cristata TaxID=143302 RepID=UPI0003345B5C|nr:PREDICTED: uncharacterized protein C16orf92 homolog [Condylura cristata]